MGLFHILHRQSQVEFALAQIVFLRMIPEPGQLQLKLRFPVPQKREDEAAVRRFLSADRLQPQRVMIKSDRPLQIRHIKIKMVKSKHRFPPVLICLHYTAFRVCPQAVLSLYIFRRGHLSFPQNLRGNSLHAGILYKTPSVFMPSPSSLSIFTCAFLLTI